MDLIPMFRAADLGVLRFINADLANPTNDILMKIWSMEAPWFILAAFFLVKTAYRRQWSECKALLWIAATIGVSDALAAHVIKPLIGRLRPCKVEALVRIVEGCAGSLSFPSNHASNAAAFAVIWWLWQGPRAGILASACAIVVGFSRVYLGYHYPSDVVGGFILGTSIACVSFLLFRLVTGRNQIGGTVI
jgi:undecaprenyl-diphosphatase